MTTLRAPLPRFRPRAAHVFAPLRARRRLRGLLHQKRPSTARVAAVAASVSLAIATPRRRETVRGCTSPPATISFLEGTTTKVRRGQDRCPRARLRRGRRGPHPGAGASGDVRRRSDRSARLSRVFWQHSDPPTPRGVQGDRPAVSRGGVGVRPANAPRWSATPRAWSRAASSGGKSIAPPHPRRAPASFEEPPKTPSRPRHQPQLVEEAKIRSAFKTCGVRAVLRDKVCGSFGSRPSATTALTSSTVRARNSGVPTHRQQRQDHRRIQVKKKKRTRGRGRKRAARRVIFSLRARRCIFKVCNSASRDPPPRTGTHDPYPLPRPVRRSAHVSTADRCDDLVPRLSAMPCVLERMRMYPPSLPSAGCFSTETFTSASSPNTDLAYRFAAR